MPDGVIKDNPLLRALQNSITDGAPTGTAIRRPATGDRDIEKMLGVLRHTVLPVRFSPCLPS